MVCTSLRESKNTFLSESAYAWLRRLSRFVTLRSSAQKGHVQARVSFFATPNHFCPAKDLVLVPSAESMKKAPASADAFFMAPLTGHELLIRVM